MNTVISVKTDKATKEAAQAVAKSAGLNLSVLINAYLKQVVATRRIELYAPEPMSPELEQAIAAVEQEIAREGHSESFEDAEAMLADLKR